MTETPGAGNLCACFFSLTSGHLGCFYTDWYNCARIWTCDIDEIEQSADQGYVIIMSG